MHAGAHTEIGKLTGWLTGRRMPGVSSRMHWKRSPECTPMMRCRVVWALGVTMDSFWPRTAFSSVLLPALGLPMMAT